MEVLLADGRLLTTQEMPTPGPDLAQLFIQSNLGIVTAIRIPLFPVPEKVVTFTLSFESDEAFFDGMIRLRELRKAGVITSLLHTGNHRRWLKLACGTRRSNFNHDVRASGVEIAGNDRANCEASAGYLLNTDPGLLPSDHGFLLQAGSPARDGANSIACPWTDQTGTLRAIGGIGGTMCDIGAIEMP